MSAISTGDGSIYNADCYHYLEPQFYLLLQRSHPKLEKLIIMAPQNLFTKVSNLLSW